MRNFFIDIHTHILPEMDDGSKSWEETLQMCRIAVEDGIKTIALTPHIRNGAYWFEEEEISQKAGELKKHVKEHGIALNITTGADVHLDPETLALIEKGIYSINPGRKYVLIELPDDHIPQKMEENIFHLLIKGITPILSHPERNYEIQRNPQKLYELVNKGLLAQVTASSITGGFGIEAKKTAEVLIRHRLVHIIASDAHSVNWRPPVLKE
ncbi:MAG: CpsB/CapC family capsule biosynthesis tyrosine phosphatase, partial [Nitrospinota bacterium]